jgi:hypothetical protein
MAGTGVKESGESGDRQAQLPESKFGDLAVEKKQRDLRPEKREKRNLTARSPFGRMGLGLYLQQNPVWGVG